MPHGSNFRGGHLPNWISRLYDAHTHAISTLDTTHRLAHDGMVFSCTGKASGLADTASASFMIATGANVCHMHRAELYLGGGDCTLRAYGPSTTSADGATLAVHNTNMNSSNTPTTVIHAGPTVTDTGDLLHTSWAVPAGVGIGQAQIGLQGIAAGEEWILAPNTKHVYTLTNNSGAAIDYAWDILFYELSYEEWMGSGENI